MSRRINGTQIHTLMALEARLQLVLILPRP